MREVATALKSLPAIFVDYVLPQLPRFHESLRRASWLLDAGCGAGWALVQFAQRFPKLRCTGVDVEPYSVSLAKDLILRHGLSDRCEARLGDAGQILASAAYDVATSFLVIHELDPGIKPAVFRSVAQCLAPGGSFLVFDEAYPENDDDLRTMPGRFAALAQWYELTWGNRVNTRSELHSLCRQAGLEVTEETAFSRFHILVATKQ
jgi:cyclopropane fatty-acyl-phospholipid synthase-like methyltransferase